MGKYTPSDKEKKLCEWVYTKFKQSYVAKAPLMEQWKKYMKAYTGELFLNDSRPDYKSNQVSNLGLLSVIIGLIASIVENTKLLT